MLPNTPKHIHKRNVQWERSSIFYGHILSYTGIYLNNTWMYIYLVHIKNRYYHMHRPVQNNVTSLSRASAYEIMYICIIMYICMHECSAGRSIYIHWWLDSVAFYLLVESPAGHVARSAALPGTLFRERRLPRSWQRWPWNWSGKFDVGTKLGTWWICVNSLEST